MSVFIGYRSAYEYWRACDPSPVAASSRAHPKPGNRPAIKLDDLDNFDEPLHIVVADSNDRVRTEGVRSHVWTGVFSAGSFVKLSAGAYVSSPERSFMEMAGELSLIELIRYGYVLCSKYAYDNSERGFHERPPVTTVQSIARFAEKTGSRNGAKNAARALRFIANTSASPMETNLVMSLCLPRMIGGYGLELPELNPRVEARTKGLIERDHFSCDLYWRKRRIAVEYDSREHHSGAEAETRDSSRRSALLSHRITTVSITPEQFFDARKLDEAARAVAKLIGQRLPKNEPRWMMKRYNLRAELLEDMRRNRPAAC